MEFCFAGSNHTFAVKSDGTLWVWGINWDGQLGLGDESERNIPEQVVFYQRGNRERLATHSAYARQTAR